MLLTWVAFIEFASIFETASYVGHEAASILDHNNSPQALHYAANQMAIRSKMTPGKLLLEFIYDSI
jgi:hypothetical protein